VCVADFLAPGWLSPLLFLEDKKIFFILRLFFRKLHISRSIIGIVSSVEICATFLFGKRRSAPRDPVSCRWNQNIDHIPPDEIPTELLFYLCEFPRPTISVEERKKKEKGVVFVFWRRLFGGNKWRRPAAIYSTVRKISGSFFLLAHLLSLL
jgi:hypothetical protein